eukprot:Tamp_36210.p2 GENE.Tamp_36210~~Tamp_36210.p2  ORF type:complete len:110 (-),score=2.77 Tamp_36210:196-525(-)
MPKESNATKNTGVNSRKFRLISRPTKARTKQYRTGQRPLQTGHGSLGRRVRAERSGNTKNAKRIERDQEYGREFAQISPHIQADQSAHRAVSHRGSARPKRAKVASGVG